MRVFLSWSGQLSHRVALAFREWLPSVIQSVEPYVSSEDIDKGARWSAEMAEELEKSRYGIICVTKENVSKAWINFEAGALSRSIEKTTVLPFSSAVSPFLFDLKPSDLEGPLTQFQYVINERADILKLVASINGKVELKQLPPDKLENAFDHWWPDLEKAFAKIISEAPRTTDAKTTPRNPQEILEELLELVRAQQRLMVSKEDIPLLISSISTSIRAELDQQARSGFGIPFGAGQLGNILRPDRTPPIFYNLDSTPNVASRTTNLGFSEEKGSQQGQEKEPSRPEDSHKKPMRPLKHEDQKKP